MKVNYIKCTCVKCGRSSIHNIIEYGKIEAQSDLDTRLGGGYARAFYCDVYHCPYCNYSAVELSEDFLPKDLDYSKDSTFNKIVNGEIDIVAKKFMLNAYLYELIGRFDYAFISYLKASWRYCDRADKSKILLSRSKMQEMFEKMGDSVSNINTLIMIDTLRKNLQFDYALVLCKNLLKKINNEFYKKIIFEQVKLIDKKDSSNHNLSELKV